MNHSVPQGGAWRNRAAVAVLGLTTALTLQLPTAEPADAANSLTTIRGKIDSFTDSARKKAGCQPLTIDSRLTLAAQRHANDMSAKNYFSHTSKDGTSWSRRIIKAGYTKPGGENIARGYTSSWSVVQAWMNSPGHRRNILTCSFKRIGVGYNPVGHYWVQDFGY